MYRNTLLVNEMTKANAQTNKPAEQAAETPKAPSFFEALTLIAKPVSKLSATQAQADPKLALRTRFANGVTEQIKVLRSAETKTRWFAKQADGSYTLTIRNGNTAMAINGTTYFSAPDAAQAVAFLEAVIVGAKAGELDKVLEETNRAPRAKKVKTETPPAAPAAPAPASAAT